MSLFRFNHYNKYETIIPLVTIGASLVSLFFVLILFFSKPINLTKSYPFTIKPVCAQAFDDILNEKFVSYFYKDSLYKLVQSKNPLSVFDISKNTKVLSLSSADLFCSFILFDNDELRSIHFELEKDNSSYFGFVISAIEEKEIKEKI